MSASATFGRIFTRQFATAHAEGAHAHGGPESAKLWKNIFYFVGGPAIVLGMVNCYLRRDEEHDRPEFVPYDHMRIITKPFPWGDGKKPLFFNSHMNATQEGYEDEL